MQRRRRRHRSHSSSRSEGEADAAPLPEVPSGPAWVMAAATGIPVLAAFMGTGETGWEQGILALLLGTLMLMRPPTAKLPSALGVPVAAFFAITLLTLVPMPWPYRPEWWTTLKNDFGVDLGGTWSPQPFVTLEVWCRYALCAAWLLWWVCRSPGYMDQRNAARFFSFGLAGLAITSLVFRTLGFEPAWWDYPGVPQFGPMANRNVFAALMSLGCIAALASAYDLQRRRHGSWLLHAMAVLPMFASVLLNRSRAGIVLFLLTIILWFATTSLKRGMVQRMAIAGSMLLAATAALMIFGKPLLDRFTEEHETITEMISEDGRVSLFSEALDLAMANPGLGFGLGNFSDVFGLTNALKDAEVRFRHPESDWLWLLTECGLFATAFLLVAGGMLAIWSLPIKTGNDEARRGERRLHTAAAIGVFICLIHATVNPALHSLPFFLCFAAFCGMAVFPSRWNKARGISSTRLLQGCGVLSILAGLVWMGSQLGMTVAFGQTAQRASLERAVELGDKGDASGALDAAESAVRAAPLNWESYFQRASAKLDKQLPVSQAAADFAVSRYLEPSIMSIPYAEADVWLRHSPENAISAWREALRRAPARFQASFYSTMLTQMRAFPELRDGIRSLAQSPPLLLQYLYSARDEDELKRSLQELLTLYPALDQLSSIERRRVFSLWYEKGDRNALVKQIQETPAWGHDGWPILARHTADQGDPHSAYDMAMKNIKPPVKLAGETNTTITQLTRDFSLQPNDPRRGLELFQAQLSLNQTQDALNTLMRVKSMQGAPRYLDYEFARVYAKMNDYPRAWESLKTYIAANPEF